MKTIWIVVLALWPGLAGAEVLMASHDFGGFRVELRDYAPEKGGARGGLAIWVPEESLALGFRLDCDTGRIEWRSDVAPGRDTAEGAVTTVMGFDGSLTATMPNGAEAFYPPNYPDIASSGYFAWDSAAEESDPGRKANLIAVGQFLKDFPAVVYAATGLLLVRACKVE
ncbi:hypothetical protein [Stagnihabitans tardus]|uniref:Uncharacterized protein n=1 Tax=Stagnihabitans tardus TaxID=2699202 RepID=A0AAE5BVN7_9RHOB|nr:hypothetical protein [Stagnihabitans tardus]NBZ87423.1 hypothetical protein [Stagnihabitans tardus]